MSTNELKHYGVKGMKWREHKRNYSDAEREVLRKIKNEKNAIGEEASYAVGRSAEKRNAAAYSRGKRKRLRAHAGRTRARQYGWGVRDHMYEISRKPVRHSDINELKHYGVKGMKWREHKYSGGDATDNTTARPNNGKNTNKKISDPTYNIFNAVGNIRKNVKKRANRDTIANKYVRRGIDKTVKRIDLTGKRAGKSLTKYIDKNKKKKKVGFSTIGHWSEPMGINELYHYGVKGMKWKNHKYSKGYGDDYLKDRQHAALEVGAGRYDIADATRGVVSPSKFKRAENKYNVHPEYHRVPEKSFGSGIRYRKTRLEKFRDRIGQERYKLEKKAAGLRDRATNKVSNWIDKHSTRTVTFSDGSTKILSKNGNAAQRKIGQKNTSGSKVRNVTNRPVVATKTRAFKRRKRG